LLLWISPGWPLLIGTDASTDSTQTGKFFAAIVALSTLLREARITLYGINPTRVAGNGALEWYRYEGYLKPVAKANNAAVGDLSLQVLAQQSGGQAVGFGNDYLSGEIATAVADADNYYYLSFDAPRADREDEYHALKITLNQPGLTVRTRSGYYDQP
jgi:VWFA-related protein